MSDTETVKEDDTLDYAKNFLDEIDNKEAVWKIWYSNTSDKITMKVVGYKIATDGVPITLKIQSTYSGRMFDIPWHAISSIERVL